MMQPRMRFLVSVPLLLLAACGASPPPVLVGYYVRDRVNARDDPEWRGLVGAWHSEYRSDGHLIVHGPGGMTVDSLWRLDGDVLTLADATGSGSCRLDGVDVASGRYRVRWNGDELHLEPLRDECDSRREMIQRFPLRRVR